MESKDSGAAAQSVDYSLGERIKYMRKLRKRTQSELAAEVGLSQSAIAHFESNKVSPTVDTLKKLAQALDTTTAIFFVTDDVIVFDMKKIQEKYPTAEALPDRVFRELVRVAQLAKKMGLG